jgi:hypothetical protein
MAKSIIDQLADRARVRVYKPFPGSDDRAAMCGEALQKGFDPEGNEAHFFVIPASQADYIGRAFRKYKVSEPFIPGADDPDKKFVCHVEGCGKEFNTANALQAHSLSHRAK